MPRQIPSLSLASPETLEYPAPSPPRGLAHRDTVSRLGPVWGSSPPPRRTLLGFQRTAPSQGQVRSAGGSAVCQLSAWSRFGSRDPGFDKTGGRQLPGEKAV